MNNHTWLCEIIYSRTGKNHEY